MANPVQFGQSLSGCYLLECEDDILEELQRAWCLLSICTYTRDKFVFVCLRMVNRTLGVLYLSSINKSIHLPHYCTLIWYDQRDKLTKLHQLVKSWPLKVLFVFSHLYKPLKHHIISFGSVWFWWKVWLVQSFEI